MKNATGLKRNRSGIVKVPRYYEDVFKFIWYLAGEHPFLWSYIADEVPDRGSGIVVTLSNREYITEYTGCVGIQYKYKIPKMWKLNHDLAQVCESQYGPGADGVKSMKYIADFKVDTREKYIRPQRRHERAAIIEQEKRQLKQVYRLYGCDIPWSARDVKTNHGIELNKGTMLRMKSIGAVVSVGKGTGIRRTANIWKFTDPAILEGSQ